MTRSGPLSPDARRLLELGSHVEPPTSEQNARMDRALATLFRAGRAPAAGSGSTLGSSEQRAASPEKSAIHRRPLRPPTRRSLEASFGLNGGKLWLALGALAATASASFWLGRVSTPAHGVPRGDATVVASDSAPPPPVPAGNDASSERAMLTPSVLAPDSNEPSTAVRAAPEPNRAAIHASLAGEKRRPRAPEPPAAPDSLGLTREIEQLAGAEAALRQGRAERALLLLEQRSVQHLLEQAAALRAIAECDLGTVSAARGARDVLARWPASAFETRITLACGL